MFQVIDRLFDIMNSRNLQGFKAPWGSLNWAETTEFLKEARLYLTLLTINDRTPYTTQRGFFNLNNILPQFSFGERFIAWVRLLYTSLQACICTNTIRSKFFPLTQGTRCPLSPLLFAIAVIYST